ncbi:hypothetical protein MTBBW1_810006 [Desulfamplus magnetovallimortis]|uniref:Uncharacterized protein n=1 Tax=Desulfamplus magnetovallimortis TaxID=1246637 RepID=A0A1W1HKN2_9BACT|nr:hypothetical protein MTBBW1_810006 [Desulfamplus magnetovallimortis]
MLGISDSMRVELVDDITYMADVRHNRINESHFKNRLLPRLSYNVHG